MKAGGGKGKGGAFERYMAKRLSLWATNGQSDDVFWRTAGSGSRGTVSKAQSQLGDIGATRKLGDPLISHCVLECKCYRRLSWTAFLFDGRGELGDFWWKLSAVCDAYQRWPVLFVKENNRDVMVIIDGHLDALFWNAGHDFAVRVPHKSGVNPRSYVVYRFEDFLRASYNNVVVELETLKYACATHHRPTQHPKARTLVSAPIPRVAINRRP